MTSTKKCILIVLGACFAAIGGRIYWVFHNNEIKKVIVQKKEFQLSALEGKSNVVPFLILGSGPASLAAALYGARSKVRTIVLRGNKPGGQLTGTSFIENWPGICRIKGTEVMHDFENQVAHFGAQMLDDSAVKIDFSEWPYMVKTEEGRTIYAMTIFIGTGATPKRLNIPGEQEYWGKGVTTCAICDAPYHKGHRVLVIGGGDTAVEECFELAPYAKEIIMVVRGDSLRAAPQMVDKLSDYENVKVIFNTSLTAINGNMNHIESVDIINNITQEKVQYEDIRGVFLAIGHKPNVAIFKEQLEMDVQGYIKIDGFRPLTSQPGVFAAGDVVDSRYRQAGVAAGDGIKAGLEAVWWLTDVGHTVQFEKKYEPFFFDPFAIEHYEVEQINSATDLSDVIRKNKGKVLILDFYTKQCPVCLHMLPVVQWVGTKLYEKVVFVKVDATIAFDLVKRFAVPQVPYFVVLKNNKVIGTTGEVMDRAEMYAFAKNYCEEINKTE